MPEGFKYAFPDSSPGREPLVGTHGRDPADPYPPRRWAERLAAAFCLGDPNFGVRLRSLHVRNALHGMPWNTATDIGCAISGRMSWGGGIAFNALALARYHPGRTVTGADIDTDVIARNLRLLGRTHVPNLTFVELDLRRPQSLPPQDVVILSDVIANRPGDDRLLAGACALAHPGGRIIVHTTKAADGASDPESPGYTLEGLGRALRAAGASPIRMTSTTGSLASLVGRFNRALRPLGPATVALFFPPCLVAALADVFLPRRRGASILAVAEVGRGGA